MRKIIEEIVKNNKDGLINYREMLDEIDGAFREKKIDKKVEIQKTYLDDLYLLKLEWEENKQKMTFDTLFNTSTNIEAFINKANSEAAKEAIHIADKLSDMIIFHKKARKNFEKMNTPWEE